MDLRPLSYDEVCQMELLHAAAGTASSMTSTQSSVAVPNSACSAANVTTTMLPIMVIPTTMMPPGSVLTTAANAAAVAAATPTSHIGSPADVSYEQFYQLQPTHIFATTATSDATPGTAAQFLIPTEPQQQQQQQQQQQHQHLPQQQQLPQAVNIIYAGTLPRQSATLTRKALESSMLQRSSSAATAEESDFEGSECGASVSSATCIPHFRFGGCGMILQQHAAAAHHHHQQQQHQQQLHQQQLAFNNADNITHQQQQQQQQQQHDAQAIGCGGSFTHMMGSFAAAAGGAMQGGRLVGTLAAGVGAGLSGTLGRNRRSTGAMANCADGTTQTPKRVSFKGDNLASSPLPPPPPEELQDQVLQAEAFNNCSYMHFDNFMDYQTTGFGGLPDVTEHSNIRRTLSRQNSNSNSDSGGEISSIQKSKATFTVDVKTAATSTTSPSTLTTLPTTATLQRKKHKTAQGGNNAGAVDNYKSRRATCIFGLTLLVALALLAVAATLATQHFFMAPSRNSHAQRLKIVRRVLQEVPLVDGHNNFAWNVRKYAHSSLELVHLSHDLDHKSMWTRPTWAQTDMERLKQGLIGVQVWSAFVPCEAQGLDAVQLALEQIDIIRRFADMYASDTLLVASSKDIAAARSRGLMASLIGIEGGHAIGSSLGVLRSFYSLGARYLSLTHKCDVSWAGSSSSAAENGLTQFGKAIIREMNRLGMMIDLSYSSDATARDVLQATRAPVIFSHSAARQLCNSTRNIPDDILRLVAENGGLIMVSFDSEDVSCGRQAQLADVLDHIKYIRSIAGIQHIGLGAGYDSIEQPPVGLEDVSKYPDLLATLLEDHNWSEEDIAMLAGKNFMRIMETVENVRDYWKRAAIQPIEQTEPQPKTQCTYMSS